MAYQSGHDVLIIKNDPNIDLNLVWEAMHYMFGIMAHRSAHNLRKTTFFKFKWEPLKRWNYGMSFWS